MIHKIVTRKPLTIDPALIIGLGIVPALGAAPGLAQALLLSSGVMLVQITTIALLLVSRRAIPPRYVLFFTVVFASGFSTLWSMFAEAIMPDLFRSLMFYPFLLPAMLPILLAARTLPQSHDRQAPIFSVLLTALGACFMLCIIALLRETIGQGTILGHPIHPRPIFAWAASTPGALTLAALIAGIFAVCHRQFTPQAGVRP